MVAPLGNELVPPSMSEHQSVGTTALIFYSASRSVAQECEPTQQRKDTMT